MLECLIECAIAAIIRKDCQRDRAHRAVATRASFALKKRRHAARRLVLDHRADQRIVEPDLEGGGGNDDVCRLIDSGVLRGCPADDQPAIERMTDILANPPALAFDIAHRGIGSGPADIRKRHARSIGAAEDREGLGITQIVVQAIGNVEIVGEQERTPAKSARGVGCAWRIEQSRQQH